MTGSKPNIRIPVELTNPGQFFACCGLLELADRLWQGAEGWFEGDHFFIRTDRGSMEGILGALQQSAISNTMTPTQIARLNELSTMTKKKREAINGLEEEKSELDGMRRKAPVLIQGPILLRIDWFCDPYTRGFALKTWAGQQSVVEITSDMFTGVLNVAVAAPFSPWTHVRDVGLPFNFDSDLGAQGSGLDIGFSFDKLEGSSITRINRGCRPVLEFLCFVGLQRFRPREIANTDSFLYSAWSIPLPICLAGVAASRSIRVSTIGHFKFSMFQRSKDYYSFYPATPFQGEHDE